MKKCWLVLLWTILVIEGMAQDTAYKPDLYLVCIGVSAYQFYPEARLNFADSDALAILQKFRASGAYKHVIVDSFLNEGATRETILSAHEELMQSTVDDQVILFYSGHGYLDTATIKFYICPNTFQLERPDSTGVRFEEMEALLDGIPARRRLMLIDACYSGEVDPETMKKIKASGKAGLAGKGGKAFVPVSPKRGGSKTTLTLMKELFIDVRRRTGSTILCSSDGLGLSYEPAIYHQGLFTYAVLNCLQKDITLNTLVNQVVVKVSEITGNFQVPFLREENDQLDYIIW